MQVCEKGLNYNLPHKRKTLFFNQLIYAECAIKSIPDEESRNTAHILYGNATNISTNRLYKKDTIILKQIKDKQTLN